MSTERSSAERLSAERLRRQLEFVLEVEQAKQVFRQTLLLQDQRAENDAEHAWHLSLMALVLAEHAATPDVDLLQVLRMLVVHDLVEIDAGDTFAYDAAGHADKAARETAAAARIFALLPPDQGAGLRALWEEFEAARTPAARFAAALDRLQPLLLNFHGGGAAWRRHGITRRQVVERNQAMAQGAPALWSYALELIDAAVEQGMLLP